jgi:hypothetical protein
MDRMMQKASTNKAFEPAAAKVGAAAYSAMPSRKNVY